MSEPVIRVHGLAKYFGSQLIWENISFDVESCQVLVIIGRSGAGKSVLIKHINRLIHPSKGDVYVFSKNISRMGYISLRKLRRSCGMLFQDGALFDSLNVLDNIAFPLRYVERITNEKEIDERVSNVMNLVGMSGMGHKMPAEISGGMKKRVGLARAVVLQPRIMLYDEPTSGLDPEMAKEINSLIVRLNRRFNITSIVITHDINSMLSIAHKVLFIANKSIAWHGNVADVTKADNEQLQSLIKSSGIIC